MAVIQENQAMQAQMTFKEVNAVGLRNVIESLTMIKWASAVPRSPASSASRSA